LSAFSGVSTGLSLGIHRPLVFVDGMNHLCPEISGRLIAFVDALVQPLNGSIGSSGPVLFNQSSG
jgi:hypothetical protein